MYNNYNIMHIYACNEMGRTMLHHVYIKCMQLPHYCWAVGYWGCQLNVSRHECACAKTMHLKASNSMYIHNILNWPVGVRLRLCMEIYICYSFYSVVLFSGVLTATTAFLGALWVATMTIFGIVTTVLCWRTHKLKQNGITTNQIVAC